MSDGLLRSADEFRTGYRDTLGGIATLVTTLDDAAARRDTGCPGWTVRDIGAHVNHLEFILLGGEDPAHTPPPNLPHVRSQMGQFMEIGVDLRRRWPLARLLDEFRDVTARRERDIDAITDDALEQEARGILGTSKLRGVLTIRIFDLWSHEQDMRRALGQPGGEEGPAAHHSRELMIRGIGRRVAERLHPEDGTVIAVDVMAPETARRRITFAGGKGIVSADAHEGAPRVLLRMDMGTLAVLGCGRADDPAARERVVIEGDTDFGKRILEDIASTP